jgi:AraC-like DNA-binding protein
VVDFMRALRLDWAHQELAAGGTIQEAAAIAGYSNAANFSTAFRKRFGHPPGRLRTDKATRY